MGGGGFFSNPLLALLPQWKVSRCDTSALSRSHGTKDKMGGEVGDGGMRKEKVAAAVAPDSSM